MGGERLRRGALLLWLLMMVGCSRAPMEDARPGAQVEERIPALVSMAAAHHKRADLALQREDRAAARQEMEALIKAAQEHGPPDAEGFDVLFDASARLARMQLEDGAHSDAIQTARRGLAREAEAPPSLFRGHLHQILGDALEANGDPRGAVEEHGAAIEIFRAILERGAPAQKPDPEPPAEAP